MVCRRRDKFERPNNSIFGDPLSKRTFIDSVLTSNTDLNSLTTKLLLRRFNFTAGVDDFPYLPNRNTPFKVACFLSRKITQKNRQSFSSYSTLAGKTTTGLTGSLCRRDSREGAVGKESSRACKPITPASPCKACLQIWKSPISSSTIFWGNPSRFFTSSPDF